MDSDTETEESMAMSRTWDKMKTNIHKFGFVEGMTLGKDEAFQKGFDQGYAEGFNAGHNLGKLNGVLRTLQENFKNDTEIGEVVKNIEMEPNTRRGLCLLCNPQNLHSCLENLPVKEAGSSTSLDINIKSQHLAVQKSTDLHLSKIKDIYQLLNIKMPLSPIH